jgi:myo-inositol 2-dehydrogenase/D-chiro-inositol 1-dehydrogenase
MITMRTDRDEIISTEVFMNAAYVYHVHAELVGRSGSVALAAPTLTLQNGNGTGGDSYPENWIPRFADTYRTQLSEWVRAARTGDQVGARAWDDYIASAVAEQVVQAFAESRGTRLAYAPRSHLYDRIEEAC